MFLDDLDKEYFHAQLSHPESVSLQDSLEFTAWGLMTMKCSLSSMVASAGETDRDLAWTQLAQKLVL